MGIFKTRSREKDTAAVQTLRKSQSPFIQLDRYIPLHTADRTLYEAIREAVPVVDAAIGKLVRLVGGFELKCGDPALERMLRNFADQVQVGATERGLSSFVGSYFDSLLTYGNSLAEIVLTGNRRDIYALCNVGLREVELERHQNGVDARVCVRGEDGAYVPVKYPELILFTALNPAAGEIKGNSILKGLPFVSSVLLRIFHAIGQNWERVGNVRFAVTYKPQDTIMDKAYAKERAAHIAREWSLAMKDEGTVRDFISVGDVEIKTIGADNQVLDSHVPVRQLLEQIVAKTGIPPFLLGLSWSSTERMSVQQADILTTEIEAYRRILTPVIHRIVKIYLALHGHTADVEIVWESVNLQDQVEEARAHLYTAQAQAINRERKER